MDEQLKKLEEENVSKGKDLCMTNHRQRKEEVVKKAKTNYAPMTSADLTTLFK